jgi:hypothetical protein
MQRGTGAGHASFSSCTLPDEGFRRRRKSARAFSGEVAVGSPQKMRSLKEQQSEFRFHLNRIRSRAFSGEVDTGSPQKMRSLKEQQSEFRFHLNRIRSRADVEFQLSPL